MRSARGIVLAELLVGCSVTAEEPVTTAPAATTADPTPVVTVTVVETVTPSPDPTPAAEATSPNVRNYVAPDPAYVAQFLKAEFRERLDREPDQDELNWHIEWFMAEDREGGDTEARWGRCSSRSMRTSLRSSGSGSAPGRCTTPSTTRLISALACRTPTRLDATTERFTPVETHPMKCSVCDAVFELRRARLPLDERAPRHDQVLGAVRHERTPCPGSGEKLMQASR